MIAPAQVDFLFYISLGLEGFIDSAKDTLNGENVELVATADDISSEELEAGQSSEKKFEEGSHEENQDAHDSEVHEGELNVEVKVIIPFC